jgi:hypothetical protein
VFDNIAFTKYVTPAVRPPTVVATWNDIPEATPTVGDVVRFPPDIVTTLPVVTVSVIVNTA